ncbi:uncharacterized protein LOC126886208 [Diabrotica virgifera virgifera]|uniref:CCHC-type domain-containing protein n=1 Tax=Diabrotica virgifera virgifera TaxID=50390 RepID=A0ABM5KFQ3_DIAVI|nr:uncharacterized protein LOC126886208 [Diabrotica virgifera virgifera]
MAEVGDEVDRLKQELEKAREEVCKLQDERQRVAQNELNYLRKEMEELRMAGNRRVEMIGAREVKEWCGSEGEMSVEEFVERVEMLQQINGWTEQNTADLVRRRMIGESAEFLRNATSQKQEGWTWKEIKGLLLQRFGVKKDRVEEMAKLMNIRRKEGENYRRFADRCRTAARYVVKEYEKEEEKQVANEIREEMILGVFMEGLNSEVRRVVKARKGVNTLTVVLDMLKDIGEEGDRKRVRKVRKELEEEEANSSGSEESFATVVSNSSERRGIRRIEGEKKEGFVKMNRADAIVAGGSKWHDRANPAGEVQGERQRSLRRVPYAPCRRCGQVGHWTRECTIHLGNQKSGESRWKPEEGTRVGKRASNEECFQCGRPGHFINTCPQTICDNCGYGGHVWRQCQNTGTSARRGPFSRRQPPWESDKSDRGVEDYASLAGRRAESRSVSPN